MRRFLVYYYPVVSCQIYCLLDRQTSQDLLIDVDDLILLKDLSGTQYRALNFRWHFFELEAP